MPVLLIIDDEPERLPALQEVLGGARYDYGTASSGGEARAFLQSRGDEVDAVLLDWVLPDVDGIELLGWAVRAHG